MGTKKLKTMTKTSGQWQRYYLKKGQAFFVFTPESEKNKKVTFKEFLKKYVR